MKFKKLDGEKFTKSIELSDKDGDVLKVQTHFEGKKKLYFETSEMGVFLTHQQSLKLAWAIINELSHSVL